MHGRWLAFGERVLVECLAAGGTNEWTKDLRARQSPFLEAFTMEFVFATRQDPIRSCGFLADGALNFVALVGVFLRLRHRWEAVARDFYCTGARPVRDTLDRGEEVGWRRHQKTRKSERRMCSARECLVRAAGCSLQCSTCVRTLQRA